MKFLAFAEWAATNAAYDASEAPYWHVKPVGSVFTALSGIFWSISYILMVRQGFKDKSYAMPIFCLCLNIAWEGTYGFVYGPGRINQFVFGQWMIVDAFLVYTTVKFGKNEWRHSPLVANNLGWIIFFGCIACVWLQLSIAANLIPVIGRQVVAYTGWTAQAALGIGSLAQLISRGHTKGQSWGIWWTRFLGTVAAAGDMSWRGYFWPERMSYVFSPYGIFLFWMSEIPDIAYAVIFWYIRKKEASQGLSKAGKAR